MAKFRKSVKIAPGVKLNLSKSGVSGTFGVKGASVNVGKDGAYLNTGIPGTGIYDRKKLGGGATESANDIPENEGIFVENPTPEQAKARDHVIGGILIAVLVIDVALSIWLKGFNVINIIFMVLIAIIALGCFAPKTKKAETPAPEEKT
jgi:hypothetical protein